MAYLTGDKFRNAYHKIQIQEAEKRKAIYEARVKIEQDRTNKKEDPEKK